MMLDYDVMMWALDDTSDSSWRCACGKNGCMKPASVCSAEKEASDEHRRKMEAEARLKGMSNDEYALWLFRQHGLRVEVPK